MTTKYKYKNVTDQDIVVMNVGVVKAGETIEVDTPIENPNLQLVPQKGERMVGLDPVTPQPEQQ